MKKQWMVVVTLGALAAVLSVYARTGTTGGGCMTGGAEMMGGAGTMGGGGMMGMSMQRHHFAMMKGIDPRYASRRSPLDPSAQDVQVGRRLYEQNCEACHGVRGRGDGEAGTQLRPRPANIAAFAKMPMATDAYLYWTIAEGGVPVGSAMPAFKDSLGETEIWQIVAFVRRL